MSPVIHARLHSPIATFQAEIVPDSLAWVEWLDQPSTHAFALYDEEADECLCRAHKREGGWYVYRIGRGKMREVELGSSATVTMAALWTAYDQLIAAELREQGSTSRQT